MIGILLRSARGKPFDYEVFFREVLRREFVTERRDQAAFTLVGIRPLKETGAGAHARMGARKITDLQ
jgi:hypothetical protein